MEDKALINKTFKRNALIAEWLPFVSMILVVGLFGVLTHGDIFSKFNLKTIWNQCYLFIIGGLGMVFLFAQGAVDLSAGSVIALASIYGAMAANSGGVIPCLIVCLLIGTACGAITGGLYAKTDIPIFILGLSVSFLIRGVLYRITDGAAVISIPVAMKQSFNPLWISIAVVIFLFIVVLYFFDYNTLGKHSRAIGAGPVAAEQSGVNVPMVKWTAFAISGLFAGIAAFMMVMKTGSGGPAAGTSFEFNVMIAMILGGMPSEGGAKSKIKACFIGAVLISFYTNGMVMLNIDSRVAEIIKGVVFILVVVLTKRMQAATSSAKGKKTVKAELKA